MGALQDFINKNGHTPRVNLLIKPLDSSRENLLLTQFLNYHFTSSVLIPVDAFSFTFALPNSQGNAYGSISQYIQEGDIAELYAGKIIIGTGIIDVVDIETTNDGGDVVTVSGRNLLGQLEDQSAVNSQNAPLWGNDITLQSAVGTVIQTTRIRGLVLQQSPAGTFLFATEPGESKLSALQRFVEPLNCVIFGDESGNIIVGRPNMDQATTGAIICDRVSRYSNVINIKATRASTQIPNSFLPIWTGQENVQNIVAAAQQLYNPAEGPTRLRKSGHYVQKAIVVSNPQGNDPNSLSDLNNFKIAGSLFQAYSLREIAKANIGELLVQANVKSHYNDDLTPFLIDQTYDVNYSRAGVQEKMYLYQVDYSLDPASGPRTSLSFCRLGCIVAGISTSTVSKTIINSSALPKL